MSKRQQLVAMYSMLNHVAQEAGQAGHGLISTLSAAAAEATREELAALDRHTRRQASRTTDGQSHREEVDSFA